MLTSKALPGLPSELGKHCDRDPAWEGSACGLVKPQTPRHTRQAHATEHVCLWEKPKAVLSLPWPYGVNSKTFPTLYLRESTEHPRPGLAGSLNHLLQARSISKMGRGRLREVRRGWPKAKIRQWQGRGLDSECPTRSLMFILLLNTCESHDKTLKYNSQPTSPALSPASFLRRPSPSLPSDNEKGLASLMWGIIWAVYAYMEIHLRKHHINMYVERDDLRTWELNLCPRHLCPPASYPRGPLQPTSQNGNCQSGPPHLPGASVATPVLCCSLSPDFSPGPGSCRREHWPLPRPGLPHNRGEGRRRLSTPAYRDGQMADTRLSPRLSLFPSRHPGV